MWSAAISFDALDLLCLLESRVRYLLCLLVTVGAFDSFAQSTKPATGTGIGHVYCTDTNAPSRMTRLRLEPVNDSQASSGARRSTLSDMPLAGSVQTAVDGSFLIPNVAPGRYYVLAIAAGYMAPDPHRSESDHSTPSQGIHQSYPVVQQVEVQADQTASIDIRLERGAAVNGTVRYDDGSPAAGIHVGLVHLSELKSIAANSDDVGVQGNEMTDDLGHYRISGVAAGKYTVEALLSHIDLVPSAKHNSAFSDIMRSVLIVYSGDATRKSTAASFALSLGEERTGEDITIPLSKLHSISGVVTAVRDGRPVNSGSLELISPEDKELVVDAQIANDGAFHLDAVPEGSYILRLHGVRDRSTGSAAGLGNQFTDVEEPLNVESDIPNLALTVGAKVPSATRAQF
jgi:hypothetical protein